MRGDTAAGRVRLAILGAGAATELCHLPAAALLPEVEIALLVDTNVERARALAARFGVEQVAEDYREAFAAVDGVVNALPHDLHAPVTLEFVKTGIPVLVEKPLAISSADAVAIADAAEAEDVPVQPAYMRRLCTGAQFVARAVRQGWLGRVQSFELQCGFVYDWPVASGFFFDRRRAGGGVLIDTGSHFLDLLLWWLGPATAVEYRDDAAGGVEAECELAVTLGEVEGRVILSRLRQFPAVVRIVGEGLTIEYDLPTPDRVRLWATGDAGSLELASVPESSASWQDVYAIQLQAFAAAVSRRAPAPVTPRDVVSVVELIERCYRERGQLEQTWARPARAFVEG